MQTAGKLSRAVSTWPRKRQSFSKDFKVKVILEALREESTIQEIAVKHGVHPNQILQWKASVLAIEAPVVLECRMHSRMEPKAEGRK